MKAEGRIAIVVNPMSGGGKGEAVGVGVKAGHAAIRELARELGASDPQNWPVILTTKDGSWRVALFDLVRSGALRGVIAVGGDGTLSDVARSLYDLKRAGVGVAPDLIFLPGGRGNDFVRGLYGYASSEGDVFRWLEAGRVWEPNDLDLGSCNGRVFLNMASLGYGGDVVEKVETRKAFWSKSALVYQIEGALGMLGGRVGRCEVKVDDQSVYSGEFFGAFIGNGQANGTGLYWTPEAKTDDGVLDGLVFAKPKLSQMIGAISAAKAKKDPPFVHTRMRGAELVFHFDHPASLELDGERAAQSLTHEFRSIPQALRIWVPVKS